MTHIAGGASGVVAVVGPDCPGNEAVKDYIEIKERERGGFMERVELSCVVLCCV